MIKNLPYENEGHITTFSLTERAPLSYQDESPVSSHRKWKGNNKCSEEGINNRKKPNACHIKPHFSLICRSCDPRWHFVVTPRWNY